MRIRHSLMIGLLGLTTTACTQLPLLDAAVSTEARNAPYPDLIPIEQIRGGIPEQLITVDTAPDIRQRVTSLKARAALIRGPVIDTIARTRLESTIQQ